MKLSNGDRQMIVRRAIAAAFDDRVAAAGIAEKVAADAVYDTAWPASVMARVRDLADKPGNWFKVSVDLNFSVGGQYRCAQMTTARPLPHGLADDGYRKRVVDLPADHAAAVAYCAAVDHTKDLTSQRDRVRAQLSETMYTVSTLAQLETAWPEGRDFYADLIEGHRSRAVTVTFTALTTAMGLPLEPPPQVTPALRKRRIPAQPDEAPQ